MRDPTPLALQLTSKIRFALGLYDDAIVEAERAISLDPNDSESYIALRTEAQ